MGSFFVYVGIYGSNLYKLKGILIVLLLGCLFGLNVALLRLAGL